VHPLLHGDERGAVEPGASAAHNGGGQRLEAFRIFGAVFIAGQIAAILVFECIYCADERKRGRERACKRAAAI